MPFIFYLFQQMPSHLFYSEDDVVRVVTNHFTKFVVMDTETSIDISDALLTVAALFYKSQKAYVQLRLMLHSHCAGLRDFSAARMEVR